VPNGDRERELERTVRVFVSSTFRDMQAERDTRAVLCSLGCANG